MSKPYGFAFTAANLVISILVFVALVAVLPSQFVAQAATSKNSTILSAGNSTMTNATDAAQKNNNVTTAAGNNGHIYRGGAATGSGGE
jgi:archaellum component FlaF (FlaF/FlaG flagellin family)